MKIVNERYGGVRYLKISIVAVVLLVSMRVAVVACEHCNKLFAEELKTSRSNTLVANELLAEMQAQQPIPDAKPAAAEKKKEFIDIISRDARLSIPATGYVPQDTKADATAMIEMSEGETYIGNGVMYKGFLLNGKIPGPTFVFNEGDVVEFTIVNKGTVPHGASIHAAYTQTSKYLGKIPPGESRVIKFRCTYPGVYMYHCAPGGHAIPMHIIFGQYGMIVVKPKKQYKMEQVMKKKPDVEIYMIQHELYTSGKDGLNGTPAYVMFNGKTFRYVEEPIKAKPGDFVRIYFLNVGPNLLSTFHIVGIIWDYVYWQGNPDNVMPGGQSITAGPSDTWVIDFRMPPDEGAFTMLSHAVGSTDKGAIGIIQCDKNAVTPVKVLADGPQYSEAELADLKSKAKRVVSPFEPGTLDVDPYVVYGDDVKEVTVKIIGNSFYPKRLKVAEGTTVKWVNEDIFSYIGGEFAGIHNVVVTDGPEKFGSPLLAHAETYSFAMNKRGEYKYICIPHPYMKAEIVVKEGSSGTGGMFKYGMVTAVVILFVGMIASIWIALDKKK